jgi:hypothetical protein
VSDSRPSAVHANDATWSSETIRLDTFDVGDIPPELLNCGEDGCRRQEEVEAKSFRQPDLEVNVASKRRKKERLLHEGEKRATEQRSSGVARSGYKLQVGCVLQSGGNGRVDLMASVSRGIISDSKSNRT